MNDHTSILQQELTELTQQVAALEKATESKPDYGLGEGDPEITRWEMDRVLLKQLRKRIDTIEQAIAGGGKNAYGICRDCGKAIHPDRLAVLPDTTTCIECARAAEYR